MEGKSKKLISKRNTADYLVCTSSKTPTILKPSSTCRAVRPLNRLRWFDFKHRIFFKKISWPELKSTAYCWHYWKIFLAGYMMKTQSVPQHNVLIFYYPIPALATKTPPLEQTQQLFSINI